MNDFDRDIVKKTPLERNESLSEQYSAQIFLKREDTQLVRSFKVRWAYAMMSHLPAYQKSVGVVAASAWNHAQWVALSCAKLGIQWVIFMPQTTPAQKVRKTKKFGHDHVVIEFVWDTFDDAYEAAKSYAEETGAVFVHPFDDERVVAGQGTVACEIIDQMQDVSIDVVLVAVWGGWLLAWVGTVLKEVFPQAKLIGVESEWSASMQASLEQWVPYDIGNVDTFADGVAVAKPWALSFSLVQNIVDKILVVNDGWTATTMLRLLDDQGIITEPAGALSIAGLDYIKDEIQGKNVVCITCGGNFDFARLPNVEERSLRYLGLKRYFIITFPQRPGALREFLETLWKEDDIVRFEYMKKSAKESGPALVGIQSRLHSNFAALVQRMEEKNIRFEDITDKDIYFDMLV